MTQTFTLDEFLKYKEILINGKEEDQWNTITKIRRASSVEDSPPLDLIIKAELVPLLVVHHEKHDIHEGSLQDILWTLANLGSGSGNETMYVVQHGGVDYFLTFAEHDSEKVYSQALWGLANIAGESAQLRDLLLSKGALTKAIKIFNRKRADMKVETRRTIAWLVNNLCRNKPPVQFNKVEESLSYLATSLQDIDADVIVENLWACCYLTEISEEASRAVTSRNIMEHVVSTLIDNADKLTIVAPALKACSNVVAGNDDVTEKILRLGIVPTIYTLLSNPKPVIRREACYFFSNVAAGTPSQIDQIFDQPNFLDTVVSILKNDDASVVNEAVWLVSNSVMGNTFHHARKIINDNVYMPIFKRISTLSKRAQLITIEGFRELLNHVMNMPDTPQAVLAQITYYRENIEPAFKQLQDPSFSKVLNDVDYLISDVLENAKTNNTNDKALTNSRAAPQRV